MPSVREIRFPVRSYDLAATLNSGQAFRWQPFRDGWMSVIHGRWVFLRQDDNAVQARTMKPQFDWTWLRDYLQLDVDIATVLRTFPRDEAMTTARKTCRGLRLLRQEPWECLAGFILSSTKRIAQIRQICGVLCERYGTVVDAPGEAGPWFSFPTPERLAACDEAELRRCRMGFRAPYLLACARRLADGDLDLEDVKKLPLDEARERLMTLPGVGRKIADCVLLFSLDFAAAFPIDVWVARALERLYFDGKPKPMRAMIEFSQNHFGPHAGYAQQYLFHHMRLTGRTPVPPMP